MGRATINAENMEVARRNYMRYSKDKVIKKIRLLYKKRTTKNKSLYNQYEIIYKGRK